MKKSNNIRFTAKGTAIRKSKLLFLLLIVVGCKLPSNAQALHQTHYDTCREGTLGGHIPILLYYQKGHQLTTGEIVYLNTKTKKPIPVIGTAHYEEGHFTINEYGNDGYITGSMRIEEKGDSLTGYWHKPYSVKGYAIRMTKKDTLIPSPSLTADPSKIAGDYYYQYGEKGPQGEWEIRRIGRDSIAIKAWSVTHAPARNIARISETVVALKDNHFTYTVSGNLTGAKCKIVMKGQFYKDFMQVTYINDDPCLFYFGHNATLEGIFYKVKAK